MKFNTKYLLSCVAINLLMSVGVANAESDKVNLHTWKQYGAAASGDWTVSSDGQSVYQSINGHPTAFMSATKYEYRTFKGVIQVDAGAGDDDYIGFIYGDPTAGGFYLFSWKKLPTSADNGFSLIYFDGTLDEMKSYGWTVHDVEQGQNTILGKKRNVEWMHGQPYQFEMQLFPNRIVTKLDGATIFDVNDITVAPGYFGFFNWSQGKVRYNSIQQLYPPIAEHKTGDISQGTPFTVSGTWTDRNPTDTHTCMVSQQPYYGLVTMTPPCNFTYTPSPDNDGIQTFKYRVTDESNLFTDGIVDVNVRSSGTSFTLPPHLVSGQEKNVFTQIKSTKTDGKPVVNIINKPNFMRLNDLGVIEMNPTDDDLGMHHDITFETSDGLSTYNAGTFDIQVIPSTNNDYLNQNFEIITSDVQLLNLDNTPHTLVTIPALESGEGNLVEGPHEALITADASNTHDMMVGDKIAAPGDTVSITVNLDKTGTALPIFYFTPDAEIANFSIEFPWIDSPHDWRYVVQRTCSDADSNRCNRTLEMDRLKAPTGNLQVFLRKSANAEYHSYGFADPSTWRDSDLDEHLATLSEGDIVAININQKSDALNDFINQVITQFGDGDLSNKLSNIEDQAILLYRIGSGVKEYKTQKSTRWGTSAVTWLSLNQ
ncbi:Ig-like domain-containing protein [Vibrio cyclitrophicus]